MKPKAEAQRLFNSFKSYAIVSLDQAERDDEWIKAENYFAKSCAKCCVEEIMKEVPMYIGELNPRWKHWNDVKEEINKIENV